MQDKFITSQNHLHRLRSRETLTFFHTVPLQSGILKRRHSCRLLIGQWLVTKVTIGRLSGNSLIKLKPLNALIHRVASKNIYDSAETN